MGVFLFKEVRFSDENDKGKFRVLNGGMRESQHKKRDPKAQKKDVETKYICD